MTDTLLSGRPGSPSGARGSAGPAPWSAVQVFLLLVLWIVTHPYVGIVHDARFYVLQALQASTGGAFSDDLFFRYGSQDKFTVFTALYSPLVGWLGPGPAHLLAYVVGQGAWFAALLWLLRVLFEPRPALLAALGAILLDAHYGSAVIFQYGEIFATPRLYAEALSMCALALLFRRRILGSAACLLAAGLVHPLMSIAAAGVFALEVGRRILKATPPRYRPPGLAAVVFAVAAGVGLALASGKMGRATAAFDPTWFDVVFARTAYAFLVNWTLADWLPALATLATLVTGVTVLDRPRQALAAAMATAGACVLFGFFAGDLGRNVLVVNLQLWRALWLATLLANATVGALVAGARQGQLSKELLWGALLVGLATHFAPINGVVRALPILVALVVFWGERMRGKPLPFLARVTAGLAVALCLGWAALMAWYSSMASGWGWLPQAAVAVAALVLLAAPLPRLSPGPRVAAASALLICAAALADGRSAWQKFLESPGIPADLRGLAETRRGLYWEGDPAFVWVKLRRPTFYACEQGSGAMFYRGTAMAFAGNSAVLRQLNTSDFGANAQLYCPAKADPQASGPTASVVRQICRSYPELDVMVLNAPVPGLPGRTWRSPSSKDVTTAKGRRTIDRFYIYRCEGLG